MARIVLVMILAAHTACCCADEPIRPIPESPLFDKCQEIIKRHFAALNLATEPARKEKITLQTRTELKGLLREIRALPISHMSELDAVAGMKCGEAMEDDSVTEEFAKSVRKLNPNSDEYSLPLAKALVRLKKLDEAESVASTADATFPTSAKSRGCHMALFINLRKEGSVELAA
ncbi:MAG: hypothetical protein IAG10_03275, partial [Planctomycetaceae bacterium]|nr:hypothetical protein [Planctomycetaceae bacterium]